MHNDLNVKVDSYLRLLHGIEPEFTALKVQLMNKGIILKHPSLAEADDNLQSIIIKDFAHECEIFGDALKVYYAMMLANYHIGSILLFNEVFPNESYSVAVDSVQIKIEDMFILATFKKLKQ